MLSKKVTSPIRFVFQDDPAIDVEGSDYDKYYDTMNWSHLKFKDGMEPTSITCNRLKLKQRLFVHGLSEDKTSRANFERALWAVRFGLLSVENYDIGEVRRAPYSELGEAVDIDWLDEFGFSTAELMMLGGAILTASEARNPT